MTPMIPESVINKIFMFMSNPTANMIKDAIYSQTKYVSTRKKYNKYKKQGYNWCEEAIVYPDWPHNLKQPSATRHQKLAFLVGYKECSTDWLKEAIADENSDEKYLKFLKKDLEDIDNRIKLFVFCRKID